MFPPDSGTGKHSLFHIRDYNIWRVCTMSLFFKTVFAEKDRRELLAAWVISGEAAGTRALFAWEKKQYVQILCDDTFPEVWIREIRGLSRGSEGLLEKADTKVFLEQILRERKLVICGGGHVSMALIQMGLMLDFSITVIEDRKVFADRARAAGAQHVICGPFEEVLDTIEGDLRTAFVIMTREHAYDVHCLRRILEKPCAYTGLMGSRSRTGQIRRQLLAEGITPQRLDQVQMPVGLPISARTPAEIALSVMAQIVQVMNTRDVGEGFPPGMLEEMSGMSGSEEVSEILAMIVEKRGEGPRRPGTKMLVREDGTFLGTVGGGYAEAVILQTAGKMFREGCRKSCLVRADMKKGAMYCGGETTLFLLPLKKGGKKV